MPTFMPINSISDSFNSIYYKLAVKDNINKHTYYLSIIPETECEFEHYEFTMSGSYQETLFLTPDINSILDVCVFENNDSYSIKNIINKTKKNQTEYIKALQRNVKDGLLSEKNYNETYKDLLNYNILYVVECKEELKSAWKMENMDFPE